MPPSTADTASLLQRARAGDRDAADVLFARAADRVLLYVRLRLGRALRAEVDSMDVLQETYAAAIEDLDRFEMRGDGAFPRWLCRIAENRIRGLADRRGAKKRSPGGGRLPVSDVLDRVAAQGSGPATRAERIEGRERLASALDRLEDDERLAILLRHFEGRTFDAMAAALGTSASGARRILGRAMARLGSALEEAPSS